jgi:Family of unknown function (DUF5681)
MADEYEIGYQKPPLHSRFSKGQSGNPSGRPKRRPNLKSELTEELQEKIRVREGERSVRISKLRAIIKTLVAKTLKGDVRAAHALLTLALRVLDPEGASSDFDEPLDAEEREILAVMEDRLTRRAGTGATPHRNSNPDEADT